MPLSDKLKNSADTISIVELVAAVELLSVEFSLVVLTASTCLYSVCERVSE